MNVADSALSEAALSESDSFKISPLIQLTLMSFYTALVVPLPFLAAATNAAIAPFWLWIGAIIGGAVLCGGLSERVEVDADGIAVTYPAWVRGFGS